ncbi:ABC transporter permease [Streptomonospora sediminis]
MNTPALIAVRSGLRKGWIEYRHSLTTKDDILSQLGMVAVFTVLAMFMRGQNVDGTDIPIANMWLAGLMALTVATSGLLTVASALASEREDGTLLRAKAVPHGLLGHVVGKTVHIVLLTTSTVVLLVIVALLLLDGFSPGGPADWLTFAWVLFLGLLSMAPLGAIVGSLISNPRVVSGLMMFPFFGLMGISGVFFQVTGFPEWLQWVSQVFPLYWIALGMRSVFLPDSMLAIEIGESWRLPEAAAVMGVWAVAGTVVAVFVLRRMARRESGARMAAGRQKAMQRV